MKDRDLHLTVQIGEDRKLVCVCVCVCVCVRACVRVCCTHDHCCTMSVLFAVVAGTGSISAEQQVCVIGTRQSAYVHAYIRTYVRDWQILTGKTFIKQHSHYLWPD